MAAVFRSCLPRYYSNTNQSISHEHLSMKSNSIISIDNEEFDDNATNPNLLPQCSSSFHNQSISETGFKQSKTKKRGPAYSRVNQKPQTLLTRLVGTIFGDQKYNDDPPIKISSNKKQRSKRRSKKSILPSKSAIKKQFENNEKTLRSLVTLLTQIESNVKSTTTDNQTLTLPPPIEKEQARNNNRMDDTSLSHSHDTYHHKSKGKTNHQHSSASKRYTNTRSTKKHPNNKKRVSEENTLSSSSFVSHYSFSSPINLRRKMVDNQQQTQIYPTKTNTGTSTQLNQLNDPFSSEPSWLDVMREDPTTIDAWARIRRRLKPNQQKDILRALMIICANLFEVPIENKQF